MTIEIPKLPWMYVGSSSALSMAVLAQLLEKNLAPVCVATYRGAPVSTVFVPITHSADVLYQTAKAHNIDYLIVQDTDALLYALRQLCVVVLVSVCFPARINARVLSEVKTQAYNLHPSLLPRYRGPDPLFWQLRNDEPYLGISLHQMIDAWDAGSVVSQQQIPWPAELSYAAIIGQLALTGSTMIDELLCASVKTTTGIKMQEQDNSMATTAPWPNAEDYVIHPEQWTAHNALHFMQGLHGRGDLFQLQTQARQYAIIDVPSRVQLTSTQSPVKFLDGILWIESKRVR